ncbi:MAG: hypothetical protein HQ521_03105, partial [Bacteroidetes bacterium]|nr:hypothetical protein [Bacteroidota bacterium]
YFSSYLIRTEGILQEPFFETFIESCPYVIIVKSIVFYIMGLYKSNWRYISVQDLIGIIKAVTISSLIVVFAAFMFARFSYGYSRSVFIIDWMLTLIMIGGSRCVFRAFRELIINHRVGGENTLIIGAGSAGELILKEIRNNPLSGLRVVGFIDDDFLKCNKKIHGVKVCGTTGELTEIAHRLNVKEVIIAMPSESDKVILRIENICIENDINYGIMPLSNSSILDKLIQPGVKKKSKPDCEEESRVLEELVPPGVLSENK